ncbi:WD40 repeat domain-containing protein [Hymenobacter sp.]|uniref:WD40 repeat domain-containing protein n=1 Tax=Hymenobacter sp. TaxID=1898978 RepID=UPI00286C75D1|nr:WD40 repeat domain-containing protein [Hymenobacter sp.]
MNVRLLFILLLGSLGSETAAAQAGAEDSNPYFEHEILTSAALLGVDYSPDGKRVVVCGLGRDIVVYNVETGKSLLTLKGHTDDVVAVKYSPNGRYIASGGVDKALILWDALTGELLRKNTEHVDYVRDVAFSPDSKRLASAGWDGQTLVFDALGGQRLATLGTARAAAPVAAYDKAKTNKGRSTNMTSVDFSPDGTELLTANGDHSLRVWDTRTWQQKYGLTGHTDEVWDARYAPNGQYVVSGAWDNTARVWDLKTQKLVYTIPAHVSDVWGTAFSPDGQLIATCGGDRKVRVWDVATGQLVQDVSGELHTAEVENVVFSPDGRHLASVSRDGSLKFWRVPSTDERMAAYANQNMQRWARKSEFEKTDEYQKRMAKQDERRKAFLQEGRAKMLATYGNSANWQSFKLGEYSADTEYFTLLSPLFAQPYRLKVPPREAEAFRNAFAGAKYGEPAFEYQNDAVMLRTATMSVTVEGAVRTYPISR